MESYPDRRKDPKEYTFERGQWIAEEYSKGDATIKELHHAHPDLVPAPIYVRRWRTRHPEFDLLMLEAETCRAEILADGILSVADDADQVAAHNRNRIDARKWMAGNLDPDRYGARQRVDVAVTGNIDIRQTHKLSDEQLRAIALEGVAVIEGQAERIPGPGEPTRIKNERAGQIDPPHPPAHDAESHDDMSYPDPQHPIVIPEEHSVTINISEEEDPDFRKVTEDIY